MNTTKSCLGPLLSDQARRQLLLIRLFQQTPTGCVEPRSLRSPPSYRPVKGRGACCSKAKQRLKGGHRLTPSIVPKDELVQVDLKLRLADTVVRADQPLLEVAYGAVG